MSNTKREPLLSDELIELFNERQHIKCVGKWDMTEDASFHFTNGHLAGIKEMHIIYEAALAKDAELIQQLFDALYAEQFVPSLGPSPLTKPANAAAAAAGFKPTEP